MGKGTDDLMLKKNEPEWIERVVKCVRSRLEDLLAELDYHRHDLTNWRLQLRRHVREVGIFAGGVTALLLAAVWRGVVRSRQRRRFESPWYRLWWAFRPYAVRVRRLTTT